WACGIHAADADRDSRRLRPGGSPRRRVVRGARRAQARQDCRAAGGGWRARGRAGVNLAELSLKRPVTAVMFFVTLVVIGLIAAFRLPLESFPALDVPFLLVDIPYVGSTPSEIERTIARPVEDALAALPGIQKMNSTSRADGTQIFLQFKWGENVAVKAVQAREKIDAIRADLPSDLQRYTVQKFSTSDQPILQLRIASSRNLSNSYALLDRVLKRPLERIPGVARVDINGVQAPE